MSTRPKPTGARGLSVTSRNTIQALGAEPPWLYEVCDDRGRIITITTDLDHAFDVLHAEAPTLPDPRRDHLRWLARRAAWVLPAVAVALIALAVIL